MGFKGGVVFNENAVFWGSKEVFFKEETVVFELRGDVDVGKMRQNELQLASSRVKLMSVVCWGRPLYKQLLFA